MWILIIGGAVILFFIFLMYTDYKITLYSPIYKQNDPFNMPNVGQYKGKQDEIIKLINEALALPFESVSIKSFDGLTLKGKYYHTADNAPIDILFHGYRGVAIRDFCGGLPFSIRQNHNVLMIDERAQGESSGHVMSFGINERKDCKSWIEYCVERFGKDVQITLYGISMGAATVLMASGLDLPENVKCIVADCPYAKPKEIIQKVCTDIKMPKRISYFILYLGARVFGRVDLNSVTVTDEVKKAKVPILIIHGESDGFVPCYMSEEIKDNCASYCERHTFPNADHGLSYLEDPKRYEKLIIDFTGKYIK